MEIVLLSIMGVLFILMIVVGKVQAIYHKRDEHFDGSIIDRIFNVTECLLLLIFLGCLFYRITDTWIDFAICLGLGTISAVILYLYVSSQVQQKLYDLILFPTIVMIFYGFIWIISFHILTDMPQVVVSGLIGFMIGSGYKKSKYRIYKFMISAVLIITCIILSPRDGRIYSKPYRYVKEYAINHGFAIDKNTAIIISNKRVRFEPITIFVYIYNRDKIEMSKELNLIYYKEKITEQKE